ncbi:uncharacterized protein LOC109923655 [Rhincodon typus]|uniref:uncharacterized protein LOC109923655 n=1 Tax=Rhincodon typus TaxID=259920 RepID=UPI00202FE66F|nr:uncharacterized protein LOC109923655 [Rhincodon typus]
MNTEGRGAGEGMAGFPVLVEGLPVELDSVKSKLAIYFQSKKRSGGGECEIKAHKDRRKFLVYFESEQAQKNVLKSEFHMVPLLGSETVQLRVIGYECDNRKESSVSPKKVTAHSSKEPAREQSQLLTTSPDHNTHEQTLTKGSQNQGSSVPMEGSVLEPYNTEDSCLSQMLVSSDGPLDTDVVAMYFEKFASDVKIHENDVTSWFVTCSSRNDLEKIISQKQHKLGGKTLDVQLYDRRKEDEKYEPRTFLLKGFDVNSRLDHISLYIDSLSNSTRHRIEPLQDGETVVITFETDIDANSFLKNCGQKPFENSCITAKRLAKTNSVQIEGVQPSLSDDLLDLYFSNTNRSGGGDITEIIVQRHAEKAIVCYQDHEVVKRVIEREHCLKGVQLSVIRYYHDQQLSLCGGNDPKFKLPEQCGICINTVLLNYIANTRRCKQEIEEIAKSVYCNITFTDSQNSNQMILKPSFDANILLCYKIAKDWKKLAEEAIQKFIGQFDFRDFPTDKELWEKVKNKSRGLKAPGIDVVYSSAENKIVLVGKKTNILETSKVLEGILEKARKELDIERNTVEEQVLLQSLEELEFVQSHVKATVSSVEIATCKAPPTLKLKGLKEDVCQAHKIISQFQSQLERKPLNQSSCMTDFIKSLDLKEFVQTHFIQNGIKATLVYGQSVELLAVKADVSKGEDKIKQLFQEIRIDLTPQQIKVTEVDNWKRFLDDLEVDMKSNTAGCRIREEKNQGTILIVGYSNIVVDVAKMINNYLDNKEVITQVISATVMQVNYMENCFTLSELPEIQNKDIIISYIRKPSPGLKISGTAEHMNEAVSAIKDKLSQIQSATYTYNKPGEAKALSKHKDILQVKARVCGCILLIETKEECQSLSSHPQPIMLQQKQTHMPPILPPQVSTPAAAGIQICGITINLKKGDITQESTDAIVNSTNNNLNLNTGVSGAILKAAGSSVQDECEALGEAKLNPQDIANALLDAISDYVVDFAQPSLSLIRIILFSPLVLDSFRQCIEKRFKHSYCSKLDHPPAQTVLPLKPIDAVRPIYPVILGATKNFTATVEIYGVTKNNITEVQKDVEDFIKGNCSSQKISNTVAGCFSDDERQRITDLCEKYQLKVEIREKEIIIEGYNVDVLESIVEVNSMLHFVKERETRKQEEIQLKKTVQWEIMTDETAQPYDQCLNYEIERAYLDKKKTIVCMKNGKKCTIDFGLMQEKDSEGNVVDIKRRVLQGGMSKTNSYLFGSCSTHHGESS